MAAEGKNELDIELRTEADFWEEYDGDVETLIELFRVNDQLHRSLTNDVPSEVIAMRETASRSANVSARVNDATTGAALAMTPSQIQKLLGAGSNGNHDVNTQKTKIGYLEGPQLLIIPLLLMDAPEVEDEGDETREHASVTRQRAMCRFLSILDVIELRAIQGVPAERLDELMKCLAERHGVNWKTLDVNEEHVLDVRIEAHLKRFALQKDDIPELMCLALLGTVARRLGIPVHPYDVGSLSIRGHRCPDRGDRVGGTKVFDRAFLQPYTVLSVASLNMDPMCGDITASLSRALLVGLGYLHDEASKHQREYFFTAATPDNDVFDRVVDVYNANEASEPGKNLRKAIVVGATFGIMHLSTDHTYRSGDEGLMAKGRRIRATWDPVFSPEEINAVEQQAEIYARTCPHPFGLAQMSRLAVDHKDALTDTLKIRVEAVPPPLAKFACVLGAIKEWSSLPIGLKINEYYNKEVTLLQGVSKNTIRDRCHYSDLHRQYGFDNQLTLPPKVTLAVECLLALTAGFAHAFHNLGTREADGLGLAWCLLNVSRSQASLVDVFSRAWVKVTTQMLRQSMIEMLVNMKPSPQEGQEVEQQVLELENE